MNKAIIKTPTRARILDKRYYTLDQDEPDIKKRRYVPSVTEILKMLPSPGLDFWKENTPKEERDSAIANGLERGTAVHNAIEAVLMGERVDIDSMTLEQYQMALKGLKILREFDIKPVHIEVPFCDYDLGYGGTADLVAEWDGGIWLFDWKTNNSPDEDKWYPQLYAYQIALEKLLDIEIKGAAVIHLNSKVRTKKDCQGPGWKIYILDDWDDLLQAKKDFEAAQYLFDRFGRINPKEYDLPLTLNEVYYD